MRIAFLGPSFPWRGGIAQFAESFAGKLHERNHEVFMFTYINQYPSILFPAGGQLLSGKDPNNLSTQRILTPYNPFTWLIAAKGIKGFNPDFLIVSYWLPFMAPCLGFILRRLKNTKVVYLLHNVQFHEKWLFADKLTKYALKPADVFMSLSDTTSAALSKLNLQKSEMKLLKLFHPVYENLPSQSAANLMQKRNILFFGFIKHYKGLDILLRAFAKVLIKLPDLKLTIAGDVYGDQKFYLDLIEQLRLKNHVDAHFRYLSEDEIEELFSHCDVCVLPYRSATQSGVIQMSFAYEVPVIATDVGGISEAVTDGVNGLLVEPENPELLAGKIVEFYENSYQPAFAEAIRENNKKYSWDAFTDLFLDFIQ